MEESELYLTVGHWWNEFSLVIEHCQIHYDHDEQHYQNYTVCIELVNKYLETQSPWYFPNERQDSGNIYQGHQLQEWQRLNYFYGQYFRLSIHLHQHILSYPIVSHHNDQSKEHTQWGNASKPNVNEQHSIHILIIVCICSLLTLEKFISIKLGVWISLLRQMTYIVPPDCFYEHSWVEDLI